MVLIAGNKFCSTACRPVSQARRQVWCCYIISQSIAWCCIAEVKTTWSEASYCCN